MKIVIGLVVMLFGGVVMADVRVPEAQVTVRVVDEAEATIANAEVEVGTTVPIKPGWGWGGGKEIRAKGCSDTNGLCQMRMGECYGEMSVTVARQSYYWSAGYKIEFTNYVGVVNKQWQPWNPTIKVVLKRKVNSIPLYAIKYGRGVRKTLPEIGKPVGFDLEKAAWVAPYGKGEVADFVFRLDRQLGGMTKSGFQIFDTVFTVTFSNLGDGIQSAYINQRKDYSALRLPRLAPEQGYETNLVRRAFRHSDGAYLERREDQNYFFRVRTKKDDNGNIVSALYGKIHGEIDADLSRTNNSIVFTYYLNPTPNDRNLEFDPNKNLFKNLSSLEEVRDP